MEWSVSCFSKNDHIFLRRKYVWNFKENECVVSFNIFILIVQVSLINKGIMGIDQKLSFHFSTLTVLSL